MIRLAFLCAMLALLIFFISSRDAKALDPYLILGVDKSSSQREIQKAFHKLSLEYHPDKNKNKGAQEKFAEINNAYEILSDEGKRKNYDLYGDVQGNVGADGSNFGNHEGFGGGGYFTSGPGGWQKASASGNTRSFSFPFGTGSSAGSRPFVFGLGDIFSNLFQTSGGMKSGNHYSGFSSSNARSKSEFSASGNIQDVNLRLFNKKIEDQGMTWLLLFYTPSAKGYNVFESIVSDVANSLHGAVEAGKINCQTEQTLCRDLGLPSPRKARLFIYGYGSSAMGSLLEYKGGLDVRSLKSFCQEHLPRVSKRVDLNNFEFPNTKGNLPQVLLLSTRKDTPVMWRSVSGLLQKRFAFYDAEAHDVRRPFLKKELEVEALPALVGRPSNGEPYVLKAGIAVKDLRSGINELKSLLEGFERKNSAASRNSNNAESHGKNTPLLTASNADTLCGDSTPVCFIGVFRSRRAKDKLNDVLSALSRKTLVRKQHYEGEPFSFSLLDAETQSQALGSFHKSRFKSVDMLILAYKPKKGKIVSLAGEMTAEEIEKFVGSVLSGDVAFNKIHQSPAFR